MNDNLYSRLIQSALHRCLDPSQAYVLWDFPNYPNVGDSAIWEGETKSLQGFFGRPPLHVCELSLDSDELPALCVKTQIILNGGGNLGDLWEGIQLFRERVVREYPNNKIVQMPQSIYFKDQSKRERCSQVFSAHSNLVIMARDHTSYEIAKTLHDGKTELVPDMALSLGFIPRPCKPTVPIFLLLRTDKEKLVTEGTEILAKLKVDDWNKEPFCYKTRLLRLIIRIERKWQIASPLIRPFKPMLFNRLAKIRTHRGCKLLSSGHVVITDRLHAHILSVLMEIPHIVIDNNYGKISSFRKAWSTGGNGLCKQAFSLAQAYDMALELLKDKEDSVL
jgi:pyruvyl transferase EpsO